MRRGARTGLILTGLTLVGLFAPPPALARGKRAAPARGWVVDRVRIETMDPAGFVRADGIGEFRGALDVVPAGGAVAVVNELGFEEYLQGIAEVPASWPAEALRAQAIAARTFALHEMRRQTATTARGVGADICAVEACQRYVGLAKERQQHGPRWVSAVQSTAGQVLLFRGEPILAQYSSSNGGRSVAGGLPYLRAADDPDSARGPYNHWRVSVAYPQLASAFNLPGPLASLRRVGDVVALDWAVPDGTSGQTMVPVAAFRTRLNDVVPPQAGMPRTVPSTQFAVLADDQAATAFLDGRGHGHGIGMSQFGALGKATRGARAADILASYYGGLRPVTLPPEQLPVTIRVAVDTGLGAVAVGGPARFRVLAGSGAPVAVAASGTWRVVPAGRGKVRVVPPAEQEAPPTVEAMAVDPPGAVAGPGGHARFRLSRASLVRVRVEGPTLPAPRETAPSLVEPGEAAVALPELPLSGRFVVSVLADAGAGRVTTASHELIVRPRVKGGTARIAGVTASPHLSRPAAVAWALLVLVLTVFARVIAGRRPPG